MGEGSRDCGTGTVVSRTPYKLRTIGQPRSLATTALKLRTEESMKDSRFHLSGKSVGVRDLISTLNFDYTKCSRSQIIDSMFDKKQQTERWEQLGCAYRYRAIYYEELSYSTIRSMVSGPVHVRQQVRFTHSVTLTRSLPFISLNALNFHMHLPFLQQQTRGNRC